MSNTQKIEELKSILSNIEARIIEDDDGDLVTNFEHDWSVTATKLDENTVSDENYEAAQSGVEFWRVDDPITAEEVEGREAAIAWMAESIDNALSNELSELEFEVNLLNGIEDEEITITSWNPQDSGWFPVTKPEELDASGDIYAQTEAVNAKQVTVKQANEIYKISAEALREALNEIEVLRELAAIMTPAEIEKEFGLSDGTVRQAIYHNRFMRYRRADERTILIRRPDAEARWKKSQDIVFIGGTRTAPEPATSYLKLTDISGNKAILRYYLTFGELQHRNAIEITLTDNELAEARRDHAKRRSAIKTKLLDIAEQDARKSRQESLAKWHENH